MSKITINKQEDPIIPSQLVLISDNSDSCTSSKIYAIIIQTGQTKYVNIINTGQGAEFNGIKGTIDESIIVTLTVNGDNTGDLTHSGMVTLIIRDKQNGTIENMVSLKREHNNTFC